MVGICMDINYKDFLDFYEFPMAEFGRDQRVDVVLFPTAWTVAAEEEAPASKKSFEIAKETYDWWKIRMTPMLRRTFRLKQEVSPRYAKE